MRMNVKAQKLLWAPWDDLKSAGVRNNELLWIIESSSTPTLLFTYFFWLSFLTSWKVVGRQNRKLRKLKFHVEHLKEDLKNAKTAANG